MVSHRSPLTPRMTEKTPLEGGNALRAGIAAPDPDLGLGRSDPVDVPRQGETTGAGEVMAMAITTTTIGTNTTTRWKPTGTTGIMVVQDLDNRTGITMNDLGRLNTHHHQQQLADQENRRMTPGT